MRLAFRKPRSNLKKQQRNQIKKSRRINSLRRAKKWKKKKRLNYVLRLKRRRQKEKKNIQALSQKMNKCLGKNEVEALARKNKFLIRTSKVSPLAFVIALAFGLFGNGDKSLNLLASNMSTWFGITVSAEALSQRLKKKSTVNFLKSLFVKVLNFQLSNGFNSKYASLFKQFTAVKLEDSTSFELDKRNEKSFKGTGGAASTSAMKLNACYNLSQNTVSNVEVSSGTTSDQTFASSTLKTMKKGELLIRDLGYFNLKAIQTMILSGIYFLSRLQKGTNLFIEETSQKPINLINFLKEHTKHGQTIDKPLFISAKKLPVRVIALKVPKEVKEQRIKRFKSVRKKTPTTDYISWSGYSIFVTNVPKELLAAQMVLEIYKIRWQIELFFKTLKQTLKIQVIRTKCKNSCECMIYAKLISLVMASLVISYAESVCEDKEEVSFDKTIKWLHNDNCFGIAVASKSLENLLEKMIEEFFMLCKDSRIKTKSTYGCLQEKILEEEAA